jgi:hypothetical protein
MSAIVALDVLVRLKIKTSGEGGSVSVEGETSGQFACLTRELRLRTFHACTTEGNSRGIPGGGPPSLSFERSASLRFCRHHSSFERAARRVLRWCTSCSLRTIWITGASITLGTVAQGPSVRANCTGSDEMAENWTLSTRKDLEISRWMTHRSTMIADCSARAIERWA